MVQLSNFKHPRWRLATGLPINMMFGLFLHVGRGYRLSLGFFARGLDTRITVARLPLRQLGFLVFLRLAVFVAIYLEANLFLLPLFLLTMWNVDNST